LDADNQAMSYTQRIGTLAVLSSCILTLAALAAKDRNWQVGRVLDFAMSHAVYDTGTVTHTSGTATASG
jgi:hypothetical protein